VEAATTIATAITFTFIFTFSPTAPAVNLIRKTLQLFLILENLTNSRRFFTPNAQ
jgi:hypothetical protein